jgi:hypothetical protein
MTIASPCVVTAVAHGLRWNADHLHDHGRACRPGLAVGTIYYVLAPLTDSFNLAATVGGAAINTSGSQSGVHTASPTRT